MASERGLSEVEPSSIGSLALTTDGTSEGRPLRGAWRDLYSHAPVIGRTLYAPTGRPVFVGLARAGDGERGRRITLAFSRFSHELLYVPLSAEFGEALSTGEPLSITLHLKTGLTYTGTAMPRVDDAGAWALDAPGDHPHHGLAGRELEIRLTAITGSFA